MRLLVTGATGFIGRHLVRELSGRHEVHALARRMPDPDPASGVAWIEQDLSRPLRSEVLPDRLDAVIHLAQSPRYREFPGGAPDVFSVNVASTFALLEHARAAGVTRFVFASTGGVYGYQREPVVESRPITPPDNFYLSSKYAAEVLMANYRRIFDCVVLRPFFVYGPGQRGMLVPTLAQRVLDRQEIVIDGSPGPRINPIYVDDAVHAVARAAEGPSSGVYNVAGGEAVTIAELVGVLGDACGIAPVMRHEGDGPGGDLVGDTRRMREELGVTPAVELREGLSRLVAELQVRAPLER